MVVKLINSTRSFQPSGTTTHNHDRQQGLASDPISGPDRLLKEIEHMVAQSDRIVQGAQFKGMVRKIAITKVVGDTPPGND